MLVSELANLLYSSEPLMFIDRMGITNHTEHLTAIGHESWPMASCDRYDSHRTYRTSQPYVSFTVNHTSRISLMYCTVCH